MLAAHTVDFSVLANADARSVGIRSPRLHMDDVFEGRYRIQELLGRGSMGEVYRAHDPMLARAVALKVLRVEAFEDPEGRESAKRRLLHEARIVSGLEHPHIVAVHGAGESDGVPYLVLEHCDGGNLRNAMTAGASHEQKLRWLIEIAEALAFAHEHGIVHRDVRPENVLLSAAGEAKVADFGMAKALGSAVDARADQIAWAILGCELFTGYHSRTHQGALSAPAMPRGLRPVFARAMAGDPEARYPDFRALLAHLRARMRAHRSAWQMAFGAALVSTVVFGAAARARPASEGAQPQPVVPAPVAAPAAMEPSPAAIAHFDEGLRLWRDMSHRRARERFGEATNADPSFARAHLYYVLIVPWDSVKALPHYRSALDHRASLSDADARALDAIGPWMRDPPDIAEAERRLTQAFESTRNFVVASALTNALLRLDRPRDALEVLSGLSEQEQNPAFEQETRAWAALGELRMDDAKRALHDCIERSPTAGSCLQVLGQIQAHDGDCEAAESTAHRWVAAWPDAPDGYRPVAQAIYGRTRDVGMAREAFERAWSFFPESERGLQRATDRTSLALRAGDIDLARRELDEWERLAATSSNAYVQGTPASVRLELEYETSPPERVIPIAKRYLARSAAWSPSARLDFRVVAARMLLRTGGMTEEELFRVRENVWLGADARDYYALSAWRWYNFYASVAVTPRLGVDAVEHIPADRPFFNGFNCDNECEATTGEALFFGGDYAGAVSHLQSASRSCSIGYPLHSLRARHLLGRAYESLNRPHEACIAYRDILRDWSRMTSSRTVRHAASRVAELRCT